VDGERTENHRMHNLLHSILLLAGMVTILLLLGYVIAGGTGALVAASAGFLVLLFSPQAAPAFLLRLYGARPLSSYEQGELHEITAELARRAGLRTRPQLYYIPSRMMNAFTVGERDNSAIGLTDGLLRRLNLRELIGVIAHEMSHITNKDTRVMMLADVISRVTSNLSLIGQVLIFINLPLFLLGRVHIPWLAILLLLAAPTISALLQFALSRTREFDADLSAVRLTGDPSGLASALAKMERYQGGWLGTILMPGRRQVDPSLLRTHPRTEERVRRLLSLEEREELRLPQSFVPAETSRFDPRGIPVVDRDPRYWYVHGIWH
jgi:heat shock protein HtpX